MREQNSFEKWGSVMKISRYFEFILQMLELYQIIRTRFCSSRKEKSVYEPSGPFGRR